MPNLFHYATEFWPTGEACLVFAAYVETGELDGNGEPVLQRTATHRQVIEPTTELPELAGEMSDRLRVELLAAWPPEYVAAWRAERYPAPDFAQRKAAKKAEAQHAHDRLFCEGYTVQAGPLIGAVLQTATAQNISDWSLSWSKYTFKTMLGQGAAAEALFRDADNVSRTITNAQGQQVLGAMLSWGEAMRKHLWELKDAIEAASNEAALDAVDINSGWPQ